MTITDYRNFDLLIARAGERYRAFVVEAPAGEDSVVFDLPFAPDAMPRLGGSGLVRGARRHLGVADDTGSATGLTDVGTRLFEAVFQDRVQILLAASLSSVAQEGAGLRLRLRFEKDAADLATLPWETLYDPVQAHFVGLGEQSPILRYLSLPRSRSALLVEPPLRVLAVLSSPADLPPLDMEREWQTIQDALAGLTADGKFVLERLATPSLAALQDRLLGEPVHILHFVGHGVFDEAAQAGCLVLEDARGRPQLVRGEQLAALLRNHPAMRLAYLNACEGALASGQSVFTGAAQTLVREGVPAAVAMQAEISDAGAVELARTFYTALAAGRPVDAALTQARVALSVADSLEWAIPVLFSRSPDNRLFDIRQVLPTPDCPYPGMTPFSEAQRGLFFGRDKEIEDAVERLRQHPFLTVVGPSGSGKSSLIYAGVIPALRRSKRFGPGAWDIKIMRPGDSRTADGKAAPMQALAQLLNLSPQSLVPNPPSPTLLLVDQFEETFTLAGPDEAQAFLDALNGLIGRPNLHILLTVRADFYPELMASSLWQPIRANRLELTPLGDDALWAAIVEPAARVGVEVDEALAVKLIADASGQGGVLPLVQETLVLLWDKVKGRRLKLEAYKEMGENGRSGLQVAIDRRATTVYHNLPDAAQPIARRIFLRLIQFGEGRADTRRQQTAAELRASGDDPALFDQTLAKLTESRLLTASGDAEGGERRVDIAHEALIAGWPRLQAWLDQRRTAEQTRRRLEAKAAEWVAAEKRGGLLDEYGLQEAEIWLAGEDAQELGYSQELVELVAISKARLEQEKAEKEAQRQRELDQASRLTEEQRLRADEGEKAARSLRRRLIAAAAIGVIAIVLGVIAFRFALRSRNLEGEAQRAARRAQAGELAANAQMELAQPVPDYSLALLLAQEGISVTQRAGDAMNPANYRALAESVNGAPQMRLALPPHLHTWPINSIAFSPQCLRPAPADDQPCPRALLTASADETARLWDPETLEQLAQFGGHDGAVVSVLFSPDGSRVLTLGADGTIRIWSVAESHRQPQVLRPPDKPQIAGFTPDGRGVTTVGVNGVTRIWDIATSRETRQIPAAAGAVITALSRDGTMLAAVTDRDATSVLLIEVASGAVRETLAVGQEVFALEFLHDGKKLDVTSVGGDPTSSPMWETTLWSVTDGRRIENRPSDELSWRFADENPTGLDNPDSVEEPWEGITLSGGHPSGFSQVASSEPAGGFVATGGSFGEIVTWRLPITRPIASLGHAGELTALTFGANDKQILIGSLDGRLSLWDITAGKQLLAPFGRQNGDWVNEAVLSEDGLLAAATSWNRVLSVWDVRSGQLLEGTAFKEKEPDLIAFVPNTPGSLNPRAGIPGLLVHDQQTQKVYLYDPRSDTIERTFECDAAMMVVSQDGTTLAMDCIGKGIMVWQGNADPPTIISTPPLEIKALHYGVVDGTLLLLDSEGWIWKRTQTIKYLQRSKDTHTGKVYSAAFSPDGSQLAVVSESTGAISLVSALSGVTAQTWRHGSEGVGTFRAKAVAFSSDGRTLATAGDDARVRLWDVSPGARYRVLWSETPVALPASYCAASSPDDACRTIVAELPGGALGVWELAEGQAWAPEQLPITQTLGISPDGRYMIVQADDKRLCAWSTAPAREMGCLPGRQGPNSNMKVAMGGRDPTLATWDGHDLRLWRLPGLDQKMRVPISGDIMSLTFSPSTPILAVTESAKQVTLWDVSGSEAKELGHPASPEGDISRLAFSPDGRTLWMASGNQTSSLISRWQAATGQELSIPRLRVDTAIFFLATSPKGDRLAVSGADGMIYLWNVATGAEIGRLNAGGMTALAFNGNGRVLFSAEERYSAFRIWPLDLEELLAQAATRIARDPPQLTGAERRRYGLVEATR